MDALKEEKGDLERDTRLVKVYRDELDILYEKVIKPSSNLIDQLKLLIL
jgi:hypothetical protein